MSHSPRMHRILRQMYEVWEEVQADVDACEEEERPTSDKGEGRADLGPAGGEPSGAVGGGDPPPPPPPRGNGRRRSRSPSPRNNQGGSGPGGPPGGPPGGAPGGGPPPNDGPD